MNFVAISDPAVCNGPITARVICNALEVNVNTVLGPSMVVSSNYVIVHSLLGVLCLPELLVVYFPG